MCINILHWPWRQWYIQKDLASSFESLIEMDLLKMESKEFDNKPEILEFNMDIDPILDLQNDTYPYLPLI